MAKKADLEAAHQNLEHIYRQACQHEAWGQFPLALERAEAAIPLFADSLAYQRRFLQSRPQLPAADQILRLAPPLFARRALDALESYCERRKKPEREALPQLAVRLEDARRMLQHAVRLWSSLTDPASARLDVSKSSPLFDVWQAMGLIVPSAPAGESPFQPVTDLKRSVGAKCFGCGARGRAVAEKLLEPRTCPSCKTRAWFVIVPPTT